MNYLDFFASVISSITSLAWPAAVVTAVWLFRGEIRPLLPRLHLKHKDTEVSFRQRLEEAEVVVERLPPASAELPPPTPEEVSRFEQIVSISPRAALVEIRREAEEAVGAAGLRVSLASFGGARGTMRALRRRDLIDEGTSLLFEDLFAIGNAAAHDQNATVTAADARRYRALADRLIETLESQVIKPPPPPPKAID
ncbi:hypothetical protein EN850_20810 [Mesorhizobium sp. M8A.F.Ca.ET.207.01.1.1]|uniref:DUF4145 domain-containing protein n=1 Tax=Mesorhizobium sp. M8A.F.Ca.ET.207.01.1.1 TaxID=2563968 RepID=UPI00109D6DEB|nr:DUF4145 domain-containing protein [Mesorhizobium sp. M8A.F.Ca.ET.207.01.1.1]TGQ79332.1 hypothetical protein EN850_20810 [Mesorhizobium sp. M8A.F.Ca.ET.207.01.1.1]